MPARPVLILASASPRRRELLAGLGLAFTVRPVDLDETPRLAEPPRDYVERLAREKAAARAAPGELVLAADTVVVLDRALLGKPRDPEDARRMLRALAGREHEVCTGICLFEPASGREVSAVETSQVRLAPRSEEWLRWYVETGEPMDKAGSYAIQGLGALLVETVHGNYTNVVGLPLPAVDRLAGELGYELRQFREAG